MNSTKLILFSFFTLVFLQKKELKAFGSNCILENNTSHLHTIQFYLYQDNDLSSKLLPPVKNISSNDKIIFEFDDLMAEFPQYHVKLSHRNRDWSVSPIAEMNYLNEFNDFIINTYDVSQNTKTKYVHYAFVVPDVKLSGNYLLQLYENSTSNEPLLLLKFFVYEAATSPSVSITRPADPQFFKTHQQVNLALNYGQYPVINPMTDFNVVVRQNFDDDFTKTNFEASNLLSSKQTLQFRYFDNSRLFAGGNEFRFFDTRSTYSGGNNISERLTGEVDVLEIATQFNRSDKAYLNANDLNGRFIIQNLDGLPAETGGDYNKVIFYYKDDKLTALHEVYLYGALTNYQINKASRCNFDNDLAAYQCEIWLKQGIYDYAFAIKGDTNFKNLSKIEGNFSDTGNAYEVFVYHRPPSSRYDKLVGYYLLDQKR